MDIELSNRCNLSCSMCWLHGAEGAGDKYGGSELLTEEVFRLLGQVAKFRPKIYLGGSEPLIRQDFLRILRHIKELDLYVFFTSNGTLLDSAKNRELVDLGVDSVIFSLDGDADLHDQIRGRGVFQKVTSNIKELMAYKKEKKTTKPHISVNIRITPSIIGRLAATIGAIAAATDEGIESYRMHHLWYVTEYELLRHQSAVKKYLNCSAPGAACHIISELGTINAALLSDEIDKLRKNPKIQLFPEMDNQEMYNYYSEGRPSKRRCWAPFSSVVIKPNGDVTFCPDAWIDDYILGNIRTEAFADIWNNEKARRFRSVIFRQKSFPGCKRCNWLYSF